jgi:hypothetical protein
VPVRACACLCVLAGRRGGPGGRPSIAPSLARSRRRRAPSASGPSL